MERKINYKKGIMFIFTCFVIAVLIEINFFPPIKIDLSKYRNIVYLVSDFELEGLELQKDGSVVTSCSDSYIVVEEPSAIYVDKVCINLKKAVNTEWRLQVFFADNLHEFSENNSVVVTVNSDQDKITIPIGKTISRLRIDLGDNPNVNFFIKNIHINPINILFSISKLPLGFRIIIVAGLIFIFGFLILYIYEVCNRKGFIEKIKTNSIYKNVIAIFCSVLIALLYYMIFIQPHMEIEENELVTIYPEEFTLAGMEFDKTNNSVITVDDDPMMLIDIEDIFVEDVCVYFNEVPNFDWTFRVFYTHDDNEEFSDSYTVAREIEKDSIVARISVNDLISRLRLDLGIERGRSFSIKEIQINPKENIFSVYQIPPPLLVWLIAMGIYLIYLLIQHIYKISQKEIVDVKCTNRAVTINAIVLYVIIIMALLFCADNMEKSSFWKSDLVKTVYSSVNDLQGNSPNYEIIGKDPYVIYEIEDGIYGKGIIYLKENASDDTTLAVFYSSSTDDFSDERRTVCVQRKGTDYAAFELPDDYEIHYIRIDYEGIGKGEFGEEFNIESVYAVENTSITRLHGILTTRTCLSLLCLTFAVVIIVIAVYKRKNLWDRYYKTKMRTLTEIVLILVLPTILFWKYISGQTCFVFSDIAGDSLLQYYPYLMHLADRIENGQWTEMFSFIIGLGNKENSIVPNIYNWTAMFGREKVSYLMGISIFLKVALSGLFTYGWVGLWGIKDEKRLVITVGYEFNAMLTIRSCWEAYPNVAFMIILWLYCFELAYRKRQYIFYFLFAFVSELFFLQFDIYYCVLYGFIFGVYIFCRVLSDENNIRLAFKYVFGYYGIFALLGTLDTAVSSLGGAVSSGRVSHNYEYLLEHFSEGFKFQWENLYEAFIRSIGQAISGVSTDEFVGVLNFLEGPAFYFGIFMLIIIPVAYYNLPKKKKVLFTLGLLASFLFITIWIIRQIVSGFSGTSFKHTSFWITVLAILMIVEAFANIQKKGFRKNSLLVFNITAALCFLLIISLLFSNKISRMGQWWLSLIYFLIYIVVINLFFVYNAEALRWVFILAILTEGIVLSYDVLNNRESWTIAELNEQFYDDTYKAIREIANADDSWYRIEKYPVTVSLCDSYIQNYYGTTSYVGGAQIGGGVQNYYEALSLPNEGRRSCLNGTAGNLYANSLLGVKYIFLNEVGNFRYGTEYIASKGNTHIYKNKLSLPIGYCYDEVIDVEEFEKLSYWDRNKILLEKCLISNNFDINKTVNKNKTKFIGEAIQYKCVSREDSMDVSNLNGQVLVLDIHFNLKKEEEVKLYGYLYWSDSCGNYSYQDFLTTGVLEIYAEDITSIWFDESIAKKIDYVNLYAYEPDEYYANTVSAIQKLQSNGLELVEISDDEINGVITATSDGVFATSIPYDANWEIYIDGEKSELLEVNTGFIGAKITKGTHNIKIYYNHGSWLFCNKFKCIGACILLVLGAYILIDKKKRKIEEEK